MLRREIALTSCRPCRSLKRKKYPKLNDLVVYTPDGVELSRWGKKVFAELTEAQIIELLTRF